MNEKLNQIKAKLRAHAPEITIGAIVSVAVATLAFKAGYSHEVETFALELDDNTIDKLKETGNGSCVYYPEARSFLVYHNTEK